MKYLRKILQSLLEKTAKLRVLGETIWVQVSNKALGFILLEDIRLEKTEDLSAFAMLLRVLIS